jgi:hypothetical protein
MNFYGLLLSCLLHGGIAGGILLWNWSSSGQKKIDIQETAPCTIPLEVTAVSEFSQAPISKPKSTKPVSEKKEETDQGKTIIENILPEPTLPLAQEEIKKEPQKQKEKKVLPPPQDAPPLPLENQPKQVVKPKKKSPPAPSIEDSITKALDNIPTAKKKSSEKPLGEKKKNSYSEDFISVLKDVDKTEPDGPSAETPITDPNSTSPYGAARVGPSMAMTIMDRLKRALEQVWRVPLRGENLVIVVDITINPDATIKSVSVVRHQSTTQDPAYQVGVESVLKATNHYRTIPLPIPKEYREEFKNFAFSFSGKN